MGRKKIDYSNYVCSECGIVGKSLTKTKCQKCYSRDREVFRQLDPVKYARKVQQAKDWSKNNPEKYKENKRNSYRRHSVEIRAKVHQYRIDHPERIKELAKLSWQRNKHKERAARYGFKEIDLHRMIADQKGKCKLCEKEADLVIDHDHTTNAVRQLLCNRCNMLVGFFETTDPKVLDAIKPYIDNHKPEEIKC